MQLETPTDYDKALWCYCDNVTKSKYELTLSAVERCYPPLKRNIPWSRARCTAQAVAHPVRHHDPMVCEIALALAWGLQVVGGRVIAQVFLLMRLCGLRPGEAIRLCPEDFTPGSENHVAPGVATIGLGMRGVNTKAKREQYVIVPPEEWRTHAVIKMLLASAVRGLSLTRLRTVTQFNAMLRKAASLAGLKSSNWTAHSARSGWATEQNLMGTPFAILKERGRWKSDASLRVYLDSIGAMHITHGEEAQRLRSWVWRMDGEYFTSFWSGVTG